MPNSSDQHDASAPRLRYNQVASEHAGETLVVTLSSHAVGRFAERCARDDGYNGRVRELRALWEHAVIVDEQPTWIGRAGDSSEYGEVMLWAMIADIVFPIVPSDDGDCWIATTCLMKLGRRGAVRESGAARRRRPTPAGKSARRKFREPVRQMSWRGGRFAFEDE